MKRELTSKATEWMFKAVAATCMGERLHAEKMEALYRRLASQAV